MRRAGIKKASLHTLRHTHGSSLLSKGVPLGAVSARLGHADPNITARIYLHALPDDDTRAADAWESVIEKSDVPTSTEDRETAVAEQPDQAFSDAAIPTTKIR